MGPLRRGNRPPEVPGHPHTESHAQHGRAHDRSVPAAGVWRRPAGTLGPLGVLLAEKNSPARRSSTVEPHTEASSPTEVVHS